MASRPVVGLEEFYDVEDGGRIIHAATGRVISSRADKDGYRIVTLYREGVAKTLRVHRVVAQAFLPNPKRKPHVNHLDGDRANNALVNLEWATISENHLHAYARGRLQGNERPVVATKGDEVLKFGSIKAAERAGFKRNSIYAAINGEYSHHRNYTWKYDVRSRTI